MVIYYKHDHNGVPVPPFITSYGPIKPDETCKKLAEVHLGRSSIINYSSLPDSLVMFIARAIDMDNMIDRVTKTLDESKLSTEQYINL